MHTHTTDAAGPASGETPASAAPAPDDPDAQYRRLLGILTAAGPAAVAFSGGVDSSFLCYAARDALGDRALAVTVVSPMLPAKEIDAATEVARRIGIEHICITETHIDDTVAANPADRCYHCKKIEFAAIQAAAAGRGIPTVLDGSNLDDAGDYRPGKKALAELGIRSPLREAGLTKRCIRDLSRRFGLPTWDKPAVACLASRIPYGTRIDEATLRRIEQAETRVAAFGFREFRVRAHGDIARIEVAPEERRRFFTEATLDRLSQDVKACGFRYVAFELEGYVMGSLNRRLSDPPEPTSTVNDLNVE